MELNECLAVFKSDYEPCPGKYCSRVLLNDTLCLFSQCQVKFNFIFDFLLLYLRYLYFRNAHVVIGLLTLTIV